jgi:hypothetical protein
LLLAAQPQALTAERLVALDKWVRDGGRLVLLADPLLRFDSSRPLGDRFRPPLRYPDTGLLAHWGLAAGRLAGRPAGASSDGPRARDRLQRSGFGSLTRAAGTAPCRRPAPWRGAGSARAMRRGRRRRLRDVADQDDREILTALLRELVTSR